MADPSRTPAIRVADLPLGALCRAGFLLSLAFWVPLGLLVGIASMVEGGSVTWLGRDVSGVLALPAGVAGGFLLALINDALLALGALLFVLGRTAWRRWGREGSAAE